MAPRRRLALVLFAVLTALLIGGAAAWALVPPRQTADIAMPADDASPEEVVTAYLEAVAAHDCETAVDLYHRELRCPALRSLRILEVRDPFVEEPEWSGRTDAEEVVSVPTRIDLEWRPFADMTTQDGPQPWSYLLARPSDGGPWRIVDSGNG